MDCRPGYDHKRQIQNRINEISFNSSLLRELRAISFVRDLIAAGRVPEGTMKRVLVHMIADDALMGDLSVATKVIPSAILVERLFRAGRAAAGSTTARGARHSAAAARRSRYR